MPSATLPQGAEQAITNALRAVGYADDLLERDFDFNLVSADRSAAKPSSLAAFWRKPADQYTSAIAVQWLNEEEQAIRHVSAFGRQLWAPYGIIARPDHCELWDTLPSNGVNKPFPILTNIAYENLLGAVKEHEPNLGREPIQKRKERFRQMALYEVTGSKDTFLQWAFHPTKSEVRKLLRGLFSQLIPDHPGSTEHTFHLRWLLRILGVRIAIDKGWLNDVDRNSPDQLLERGHQYPSPLTVDARQAAILTIAEAFVDAIPATINLGIVDGGLLSQVLQADGLPRNLRSEWKLYPTPPDIAWRMLETIPIEAITEEERRVWDGTCGTGTLLVCALERLRHLPNENGALHEHFPAKIAGNDNQPLLADLTRIALDTALGRLQGPQWDIQTRNVLEFKRDSFAELPNIIIGNPPFAATGPRADEAIGVIRQYLQILEPGGLLATVLPRSLLGASGRQVSSLREQLLEDFELYEVWELPEGFATNVGSEAAVVCGRKKFKYEEQRSAVVWKLYKPDRTIPPLSDVVDSPDIWLNSRGSTIAAPLEIELSNFLETGITISDLVGSERIIQGITPGKEGNSEVTSIEEVGSKPYLTGRTNVLPFHIPWHKQPRWIRYDSAKLQWPRRSNEPLFQASKVLVTRRSTGGNPWAVRASIDRNGLYPSDDYIIVPCDRRLSCEIVAGLFNSSLINCWLRLSNPARNIRVNECRAVPLPKTVATAGLREIEELATQITELRDKQNESPSNENLSNSIRLKTLELDEAVFEAYSIPINTRWKVSEYFRWLGKPRPGFDDPMVSDWKVELPSASELLTTKQGERLQELRKISLERPLTEQEAQELDELVEKWQQAYTTFVLAGVNGEHHSPVTQ